MFPARLGKRTRLTIDASTGQSFTVIVKGRLSSFDIIDANEQVVISSTKWTESWWASFMGRNELRISNGEGVIARLRYNALGYGRRAILATGEGPFPRNRAKFSLLGMEWQYDGEVLRIGNVDETISTAVMGLAACWLLFRLSDERNSGGHGGGE